MMIPGSGVLAALAAWGLTCAIHGTLLCGGAWLLARLRPGLRATDLLWKTALVGALATATVQSAAGAAPLGPRLSIPGMRTVQVMRFEARPGTPPVTRRWKQDVPSGPAAGVTSVLALVWMMAAAYRLARVAGAHRRLRRCLAGRRALPEGELTRFAEGLLARPVRVTVSDVLPAPVALGVGEICLPARVLAELPPAQQRAVVAHEAAHLRRRDPLWLHLFGVMECVFFFQPLQALALRRYRETAELLCDDWAVSATGRPRDLARSIACIAAWLPAPRAEVPLAAIVEHGSPLMRRVRRLAAPAAEPPRGRAPLAAAMLLLAAVLLAAPHAVVSRPARPDIALREVDLRVTPDGQTIRFYRERRAPAVPPLAMPAPPESLLPPP
jgi:beta-lactamase regulating signal transducer with metallopeptidase domain